MDQVGLEVMQLRQIGRAQLELFWELWCGPFSANCPTFLNFTRTGDPRQVASPAKWISRDAFVLLTSSLSQAGSPLVDSSCFGTWGHT